MINRQHSRNTALEAVKAVTHCHQTRLSSNLRPTTRECVHLVTHGHFRSHHSICYSWKPHAMCKPHGSTFYRTRVMADQSFTLRIQGFRPFLLPWPWPWPHDLHIRISLLKVLVWWTDRQTDITKIISGVTGGGTTPGNTIEGVTPYWKCNFCRWIWKNTR